MARFPVRRPNPPPVAAPYCRVCGEGVEIERTYEYVLSSAEPIAVFSSCARCGGEVLFASPEPPVSPEDLAYVRRSVLGDEA